MNECLIHRQVDDYLNQSPDVKHKSDNNNATVKCIPIPIFFL